MSQLFDIQVSWCHIGANPRWCLESSLHSALSGSGMLWWSTSAGSIERERESTTARLSRGVSLTYGLRLAEIPVGRAGGRPSGHTAPEGRGSVEFRSRPCACLSSLLICVSTCPPRSTNAGAKVLGIRGRALGLAVDTTWGVTVRHWSGRPSTLRLMSAARLWWPGAGLGHQPRLRRCSVAACNSSRPPIAALPESCEPHWGAGSAMLGRQFSA